MRWFRRQPATLDAAPVRRRSFLGREYVDAPYVLPKDLDESKRLDFQHYMLRFALRGNYAAPIRHPASILDCGTGTARWATEVAVLFPQADVVGLDLVPQASATGSHATGMPANYRFVQANALDGLPFTAKTFDLVHQRLLFLGIPADRWSDLIGELARVCRSGGWVELLEGSPMGGGGPAMAALNGWAVEFAARRGIDLYIGKRLHEFLHHAGLQKVQAKALRIPAGKHADRLGAMMATDFNVVYNNLKPLIVSQGFTDEATYDATMRAANEEIAQGSVYWPIYLAYGQRP